MSSTRTPLVLAAALALAALLAGLYFVLRGLSEPKVGNDAKVPRPVAAPPSAERELERHLDDLVAARRYADAAREYPALLDRLAASWGEDSEKLIPHHYRFLESLRLAGRVAEANELAEGLLKRWPDSIRILYFQAGVHAVRARARREIDPATRQLFERLLSERNLERLDEAGLGALDSIAYWGETLLGLEQHEEALEVANRGLKRKSEDPRCALLRARALLGLSSIAQAIETLEPLAARESPPGDATYVLGVAFQEAGDPERAWQHFARLIEPELTGVDEKYRPGPDWLSPGSELRLRAARALAELRRFSRSLELLVQPGILGLETAGVLELAESCASRLDAPAAAALARRRKELSGVQDLRERSERAASAGQRGAEQLFRARAFLLLDQLGPAQLALQLGTVRAPRLLSLQLDQALVFASLGRTDRAVSLLEAIAAEYPIDSEDELVRLAGSLRLARLARLQASRGWKDQAALALAQLMPKSGVEEEKPSLDPNVTYEVVQTYLELGELARAREYLPAISVLPLSDVHRLCAAEIALRQGQLDEARRLVAGGAGSHFEGRAWAGALRSCLAILGTDADAGRGEQVEPSDLLDHPRLIHALLALPRTPEARRDELQRWLAALREREKIGPPLKEPLGSDENLERWGQLVALYDELGARRKRREVGWFLAAWLPDTPEVNLWLAQALSREEEVLPRLAAALRGLGSTGAGESTRAALRSIAERSRRALGLSTSG